MTFSGSLRYIIFSTFSTSFSKQELAVFERYDVEVTSKLRTTCTNNPKHFIWYSFYWYRHGGQLDSPSPPPVKILKILFRCRVLTMTSEYSRFRIDTYRHIDLTVA
jgi:hypothetical protein